MSEHPIQNTENYSIQTKPDLDKLILGVPTVELELEEWDALVAALLGYDRDSIIYPLLRRLLSDKERIWILNNFYDIRDLSFGWYTPSHRDKAYDIFRSINTQLGLKFFSVV